MVSASETKMLAESAHFPWRSHLQSRVNHRPKSFAAGEMRRPAAVLVPIVEREEPALLLTKRTEHLPTHAGQVCFPGGRFHEGDESLTATALREFAEETGVPQAYIEIAGFLDPHETANSGFLILPVVGFLRADYRLSPDASEVAEAFEAPLSALFDPKNKGRMRLERDGVIREFETIAYNGHIIWGATQMMIANLKERLKD